MNIIALILAILAGGIQIGEDEQHEHHRPQVCVTADKITRPTRGWKMLANEIKYDNKTPYMEITVHNPLNTKNPTAVDARFVLSIDPANPSDPQKYSLVAAYYYNNKINVTFHRIFEFKEVAGKKNEKFPIQTQCFSREVIQILDFTPEEINVPNTSQDGGTK